MTSVITATTEVVISEKSIEEFFSVEFSAIDVSRMSVMRMKSFRLGHDDPAFRLPDIFYRVRCNCTADIGGPCFDRTFDKLAIWRVNTHVAVGKIIGGR